MYVILKHVEIETSTNAKVIMPVIILDGHSEILEFETLDEAEKMRALFASNSDSGYHYEVKAV